MSFKIRGDSQVCHHDPGSHMTGQDIDPRTSSKEIIDHLGRHLGGKGAHAFLGDAVVSGKCKNDFMDDPGSWISFYSRNLNGKGFELT